MSYPYCIKCLCCKWCCTCTSRYNTLLAIVCSNAVRLSLKACECLRDRQSKSNAFIALFFLLLKYVRLFFIFCNSSSFSKINANSTQKRQNNKLLRRHIVCSIYVWITLIFTFTFLSKGIQECFTVFFLQIACYPFSLNIILMRPLYGHKYVPIIYSTE